MAGLLAEINAAAGAARAAGLADLGDGQISGFRSRYRALVTAAEHNRHRHHRAAAKWGISKLDALRRLFTTSPWLPPAPAPGTA
jgi:hypothetical protein